MPNVTTSISQYWHDMATRKGLKWSIALTVGIKTLLHENLEDFGKTSHTTLISTNKKLCNKIKEITNVLEKERENR